MSLHKTGAVSQFVTDLIPYKREVGSPTWLAQSKPQERIQEESR